MKVKRFFKVLKNVGGAQCCPACDSSIRLFQSIHEKARLDLETVTTAPNGFETLNVNEYFCPICGANDRDRLLLSYLLTTHDAKKRVLEIAPSSSIRERAIKHGYLYRCCDLYMQDVDDICDITNMICYQDMTFDVVICSHVLEHIHDDKKAISEIARILKPGGEALFLVPIPVGLSDTIFDPSINDPIERIKIYGQDDHVRMYSRRGFEDLINSSGLTLKKWNSDVSHKSFPQLGLSKTSTIYIGVKS